MAATLNKLYMQRKNNGEIIRIVHIGNSHIQTDIMTRQIRVSLQEEFGSAGRGLLSPYVLAGTNEPVSYRLFSNVPWMWTRAIHERRDIPVGLTGLGIRNLKEGAEISLRMQMEQSVDHYFDKLCLIYQKDSSSSDFNVYDDKGALLGTILSSDASGPADYAEFCLPGYMNSIKLSSVRSAKGKISATLFGISLENSSSGVLYHVIGNNSTSFNDYARAERFVDQIDLLKPDLIVFSMGTNEAYSETMTADSLKKTLSQLLKGIRQQNPGVEFLLTTPPPGCKKGSNLPNDKIAEVGGWLKEFADENKLAFFDLYAVLGGNASLAQMKKGNLLAADGIHYTSPGYVQHGLLFYRAFISAFEDYCASVSGK